MAVKFKHFQLILTSKIDPSIKFAAKVSMEVDDDDHGEIESNFLAEQFEFEWKPLSKNVPVPDSPPNCYHDPVLLSK